MTDQIRAPWTPEQVAALNRFQAEGGTHPFTCGNDHATDALHLVAQEDGWHCWLPDCDYRQDWAHAFMADPGAWSKFPFGERHGPTPEESRAATLVQVGWYCWRCRAVNRMACRSDNVPVHVPAEWADEMRAEIARREDEDDGDEPAPPQDAPHAPHNGPQHPDAGAETPDGAGGRQTGTDGREVLREQYAAAVECAIGLNVDCGGIEGVHRVRDAVLAVRDAELERAIQELAWYAAAESADAAAGSYALRAETAEQQRDRLAAAVVRDQSALAQIRLHIAAHRPRLQLADPILLAKVEAVLRQVGELEAAGGGEQRS